MAINKTRVPVRGTTGKSVRLGGAHSAPGAQIGIDLSLPDGSVPTLAELAAALSLAASQSQPGNIGGQPTPIVPWSNVTFVPPNILYAPRVVQEQDEPEDKLFVPGAAGQAGAAGAPGAVGAVGATIDRWPDDPEEAIVIPGPAGPPGAPGATGAAGAVGATIDRWPDDPEDVLIIPGPPGAQGPAGPSSSLEVADIQGDTVLNVTEIEFSGAVVSSLGGDLYWSDVSLLLPFDALVGGAFPDASPNGLTFTGAAYPALNTSAPKFGAGCAEFASTTNGTVYAGLLSRVVAGSDPLDLSTGAWTIEGWFQNRNSTSAVYFGTTYIGHLMLIGTAGALATTVEGSSLPAGTVSVGSGYDHIAVVMTAANYATVYVNGVATGAATLCSRSSWIGTTFYIGGTQYGASFGGEIDEFRVTKGVARYTSNFTPSLAAFPTIPPGGALVTVTPTPIPAPPWFMPDDPEEAIVIPGPAGPPGAQGFPGIGRDSRDGDDFEDFGYLNRDIPGAGDSNLWSGLNNFRAGLQVNYTPIFPAAAWAAYADVNDTDDPEPRGLPNGSQTINGVLTINQPILGASVPGGISVLAPSGQAATIRCGGNGQAPGVNDVFLYSDSGNTGYVGNNANATMWIQTNATNRLSIDKYGAVAIGTPAASGGIALTVNGSSTANLTTLSVLGAYAGSGTTGTLVVSDTGNTNGASIALLGPGASTPNKYIRTVSGQFQITNSAYTTLPLVLDDSGNLTVLGNVSYTATVSNSGTSTATLGVHKPGSSVTLTPVTWETVSIGGATYYRPLWQ